MAHWTEAKIFATISDLSLKSDFHASLIYTLFFNMVVIPVNLSAMSMITWRTAISLIRCRIITPTLATGGWWRIITEITL